MDSLLHLVRMEDRLISKFIASKINHHFQVGKKSLDSFRRLFCLWIGTRDHQLLLVFLLHMN